MLQIKDMSENEENEEIEEIFDAQLFIDKRYISHQYL